jgi:sugar phosphate isomerase/epimerase
LTVLITLGLRIAHAHFNLGAMNFAICNEIFQGWKIDEAIRFAAKTGYAGIEIAPFTIAKYVTDISKQERQRIRATAAQADIAITGIHWVLAHTEGLFLTHNDPAVRQRSSTYFTELVEFCSDLGGNLIVVGSPKQRNIPDGATAAQAWDWAKETIQPAVARARQRGVTICLEPLSPQETNFINTAEEAVRFVRQFHSPSLKIILDVKAMSSEKKPIPQIIQESWPHFAYFHANDKNLKGPGFGDVDFRPIARALRDTGYEGWVSVEVFDFDEGPEAIATRSLDYLKKTFSEAWKD